MRLSDFKGEEAIDVIADIIEPITMILGDNEIQILKQEDDRIRKESEGKKKLPMIKYVPPALKNHKREVIYVLARLENKTVEEYENEINGLTLPMVLLQVLMEPEIQNLFRLQSQAITQSASSGSATESTEAEEN